MVSGGVSVVGKCLGVSRCCLRGVWRFSVGCLEGLGGLGWVWGLSVGSGEDVGGVR